MKKLYLVIIIITIVLLGDIVVAQSIKTISQSRKDQIIELLNYRFKGGYYTFENLFIKTVTYPEIAKSNCAIGIAIVTVEVDCDGVVSFVKIKNPLGYGIDNQISTFFDNTEGMWNSCKEKKYTKFDIPIQFVLEGIETNNDDGLLICTDKIQGITCSDDEYFIEKIEKYMDKGKYRKVIPYLDVMIRRDPYNPVYFEMKKKAVNGGN